MINYNGYNWFEMYNKTFFHNKCCRIIDKNSIITGIGSCFNSNFLNCLRTLGMNVFNSEWGLHYNPFTILNEMRKINNLNNAYSLYWNAKHNENNKNVVIDALRHPFCDYDVNNLIKEDRIITEKLYYSILQSNVVLVSFGLSEIWEEYIGNKWIIVNRTPPIELMKCGNNRFRFRSMKIQECKKYIVETIRLIHKINKNINIVLMVAPIPLKTSYREMSPKISDILGKSKLLVAIDEIMEKNKNNNIIYFPCYEIFQYICHCSEYFQADYRHLTAKAVIDLTKYFINLTSKDSFDYSKLNNFKVKIINM